MKDIAVAISTRNRREIFDRSFKAWRYYLPKNALIVVVDDASTEPLSIADTRFETQQGIAKVKNECLRLTEGYRHVFLADDDILPTRHDWYIPYTTSPHNHLCFSMNWDIHTHCIRKTNTEWHYSSPNGCLLYFRDGCGIKVGGYDEKFGLWSQEHKDLSLRIHKAGFNKYPFVDVPFSHKYFYSMDFHDRIESSVPEPVRRAEIERNSKYFKEKWQS